MKNEWKVWFYIYTWRMKLFIHSKFIVLLWLNQYLALKHSKELLFHFHSSNRVVEEQLEHLTNRFTSNATSGCHCVFCIQEWEIRGNSHCCSGKETSKSLIGHNSSEHGENFLERAVNIPFWEKNCDFLYIKH